ncbi:OmpA family protein [Crocinitomicaceae bacterium]|nr:OmpA family protein [Crocinitomicaceae bacterium]MDB3907720.1 OmpA family protein [Crocinitomicaceae bacterium]
MRWLILLLTMTAFHANARVELQSVYFIGKSTDLTEYSGFILDRLKSSFDKGDYQIIEINSFCEGSTASQCKAIAAQRLNRVLEKLDADSVDVTMNSYGTERIAINFTPVHWNRVDIYYTVVEAWKNQDKPLAQKATDSTNNSDSLAALIHTPEKETDLFVEIPEYDLIPENAPVTIPVFFEGNKGVMKRESVPVLDQLYRTLMSYPNLTAHFRGHVCCGHNKRISSKRARYVYKYLRKRGVPKNRISYKGYSNTIPLVTPERTEADRAKNRRVDVIYTK